MSSLEAEHTTTVIVGSPYIEDFELLCDTFDPADTPSDPCEYQWVFERHGACLYLGKNAQHTLLNGALVYLRNMGFEPSPSEDFASFPEPYPPDSADQDCPNTSTYASFGPGTRNRQGELLSWADCDLISRTQRLVEDLHAEILSPNVTIAWIFGNTTPVVPVSEGNWIIGGDVTWTQSFDHVSLEKIKQTIAELRATADHLPALFPLAADKSYYPLGLHELEIVWHALELSPRCMETLKAQELLRSTADAVGVLYVVDLTPTVEVALWVCVQDAMIDCEVPTLHGGWIQDGKLATLVSMASWTAHLAGSTFTPAVDLSPQGQLRGCVFSAQHRTNVNASSLTPGTKTMAIKYRNDQERRVLEHVAAAAWCEPPKAVKDVP